MGELCLSPVGLSSITKLAPRNRVGQMLGVWFIAASLFSSVATFVGLAGLVALVASPGVRRLMGDLR